MCNVLQLKTSYRIITCSECTVLVVMSVDKKTCKVLQTILATTKPRDFRL